ncbi:hypothetical protein AB0J72_53220 [Dactylosporangium sp. NPDC049742]|uniref:hypothetical protein n=1 Tax=Dactylosporangium sp. NPDC049742 TaxID=3154737 RepID=UPI0034426D93
MLLRLAYLAVTNAFAVLRLLPMSDRDKDVEILALRHQITVLERQLGKEKVRFDASDRAFLAALLHSLPRDVLHRVRLLMRPDTVLRWHRDLLARRHARKSRAKRPGRPRTVHSVRTLVLRLARESPTGATGACTANCSYWESKWRPLPAIPDSGVDAHRIDPRYGCPATTTRSRCGCGRPAPQQHRRM